MRGKPLYSYAALYDVHHHHKNRNQVTHKMQVPTTKEYAEDFVSFLNESVTPFHAVEAAKKRLIAAGHEQLSELDAWQLKPGGKYFFARNDTCLIAFSVGAHVEEEKVGYTVLGAHTDSPCLRIKPVTCIAKPGGALMVNTVPYGGGLWHTWFDRDLGIAGRVILCKKNELVPQLFRIEKPVARIPNLAIHLTSSTERESFAPNLQEHAKALLSIDPSFVDAKPTEEESAVSKRIHPAFLRLVAESINVDSALIEDIEAQLIDLQPATLGGAREEFIYGGRLDNLCSSYQCLQALIQSSTYPQAETISNIKVVMLFDHEEIGSASTTGAGSSLFMDTIRRIHSQLFPSQPSSQSLMRALRRSFIVSADMAHALHPNYSGKHDSSMAPLLNKGLVIKHNANQRYATNALSASAFRRLGALTVEPVATQEFSVRSDAGCGSTIGPILATLTGILTVDVGTPQLSMHSIREMMGSSDVKTGILHLAAVLDHHPAVAGNLDSIRL